VRVSSWLEVNAGNHHLCVHEFKLPWIEWKTWSRDQVLCKYHARSHLDSCSRKPTLMTEILSLCLSIKACSMGFEETSIWSGGRLMPAWKVSWLQRRGSSRCHLLLRCQYSSVLSCLGLFCWPYSQPPRFILRHFIPRVVWIHKSRTTF